MTYLKPCPFCGSIDIEMIYPSKKEVVVRCPKCHAPFARRSLRMPMEGFDGELREKCDGRDGGGFKKEFSGEWEGE